MGDQGVRSCCTGPCCMPEPSATSDLSNETSLDLLPELEVKEPEYGSLYSPQLWTGFSGGIVLLLAVFLIVQNIAILLKKRWRKNRILPLLEQESSGPFATTVIGEQGFVIPKVVYNPTEPDVGPDAGLGGGEIVTIRKFAEAKQSQEIISAMELIEESDHKIIGNGKSNKKGSKSKSSEKAWDAKIVDKKPAEALIGPPAGLDWQKGRREESIQLPPPLAPPYHHHRKVSQVWDDDHEVQELYRYTSFDRLVYPPGYVREPTGSSNNAINRIP